MAFLDPIGGNLGIPVEDDRILFVQGVQNSRDSFESRIDYAF